MIEKGEMFGLLSVATVVIGDLVTRDVVDPEQLRRNLLAKAQMWGDARPPLGNALCTASLLKFEAEAMTDDEVNAGRKFGWEVFNAAIEALPENERDQAGAQLTIGLLELWNTTIAVLIGRGLLEGQNLRRDLIGMAELEKRHGRPTSATLIRCVADGVEKQTEAVELSRNYPPVAGNA